jgi:PAS domain S-box-containing protein
MLTPLLSSPTMPVSRASALPLPQRDLAATLDGVLAIAAISADADAAAIYLLDPDAGDLQLVALRGISPLAIGHRLAPGEGLVGLVVAERRSLVSDDVMLDPRAARRRDDWDTEPVTRAFLGAPLRTGSLVIGALELTRRTGRPFTPEARGRTSILADAAALLIEQTRLVRQPPPAALAGATAAEEDALPVATLDRTLRITHANPGFARLIGLPIEALVGRPAIAILTALGRPRAHDALVAALHGASGHLGSVHSLTEGGRDAVLSLSIIPLGDPSRGIDGVLLAARDVSERARLEAELREQHARSLEARDRLRAVIEVVTHELRTPLTSVLGYARLLHDRPNAVEERRVHWAALVLDKARQMARQVEEMTDVARLGSARFRLQRHPCDLGALVRRVTADYAAPSGVHVLDVYVAADLPVLSLDADRMEQVLTNLLGNAVKFWPEGGHVAVTVSGDPAGVRVDVADHGPGVPADLADRVFEPFYRAPDAAARGIPGTGLGLAVSRGIVEAHGGRMWLEPTPGGGATFSFTIPPVGD